MKQTKKYRSYNQYQLKELSDTVCDKIEELFSALDIDDYRMLDKMIITSCPIHGGDNASAFNLYHQGDTYRGNWKCRTHQCEEVFKGSIIGFIRGCLSRTQKQWSKPGDDMVSFNDAVDFAVKFTNHKLTNKKIPKTEKEKCSFVNTINYIKHSANENKTQYVSRNKVQKSLLIPSPYFISRNYSKEILNKYDVGDCLTQNREMYNRAVVPVYDVDHKFMVGCSGRSVTNAMPKWKHNDGFKAEEHLYNFWYAKEHIQQTGCAILVESPGNVWRLEEAGIHNSLALFGAALKDKQKMLLDTSGAMTIITIMDNDDAGQKGAKQIFDKCHRTYNVKHIDIAPYEYEDVGNMSIDFIVENIIPLITKNTLC